MKYFVFGSNGMMGKYFCSCAEPDFLVALTREDYDICSNDYDFLLKMLKEKGLKEGDVILNFAGAIKQRNFSLYDYVLLNSLFPHQLENIAQTVGCKLIHMTTDCVYDGERGMYSESDSHTCLDWYGKSKSLGEPENSCCIRTSIVGLGSAGNVSLLDWFMNEQTDTVFGFTNHLWNGVTCLELSKFILGLIETNSLWEGTRHVFSNSISKYELLKCFNEVFELGKPLGHRKSRISCDRTLCSEHVESWSLKDIEMQIEELREFHE
jgi:dTDP-4-dehydrorhamnose reductase